LFTALGKQGLFYTPEECNGNLIGIICGVIGAVLLLVAIILIILFATVKKFRFFLKGVAGRRKAKIKTLRAIQEVEPSHCEV